MRNSFLNLILLRDKINFPRENISWILILVSSFLCGCMQDVAMLNGAYHPYLSKSLCVFSLKGKVSRLTSVSIILDENNILDLNRDQIKERDIYFDQNSEYFFAMESMREKKFQDRIPCRKQVIRARYRQLDQELVLDLKFNGQKNQSFVIRENKDGFLYE